MTEPILTIVVPCYNEEAVLPDTIQELKYYLSEWIERKTISDKSKILFVDDGSRDRTWEIIYKESLLCERIKGLKLARNAGHQNALLAGLFSAKDSSDCLVTIDADLQDDVASIAEMIDYYHQGYEVVFGVRSRRDNDSFFKRFTAESFYKLMGRLGVKLIFNHADFRLMGSRAVEELAGFSEANMFLRGIVPLIGFNSTSVYYERKKRTAGETKYPLKKMLAFAFDGITSFSVTPIRFVLLVGLISFFSSMIFGGYFLVLKYFGSTELGWTSLITSIWLIGGLQLIAIGLIGEYIGKIYLETKRRPKYIIDIDLYNLHKPVKRIHSEGMDYEQLKSEARKLSKNN